MEKSSVFIGHFYVENQKCPQFGNSYIYAVLGTTACLMGPQSALGRQIIYVHSRWMA